MKNNLMPVALVVAAIIVVAGILGGILLNNQLQAQRKAETEKSQQQAQEKAKQESKTQDDDQATRLRICLARAATQAETDDCYKRSEAGALPPATMNGFNDLPDVQ